VADVIGGELLCGKLRRILNVITSIAPSQRPRIQAFHDVVILLISAGLWLQKQQWNMKELGDRMYTREHLNRIYLWYLIVC
jgi:hypothetical protein